VHQEDPGQYFLLTGAFLFFMVFLFSEYSPVGLSALPDLLIPSMSLKLSGRRNCRIL
jgi:hypothetical protein